MGSKTANPDDSASGRISLKCKKEKHKALACLGLMQCGALWKQNIYPF